MSQNTANYTNIILVSTAVVMILVSGMIFFSRGEEKNVVAEEKNTFSEVSNVSIADGKQIIEITAKGGYSPRQTTARANTPTIIKVKTKGTFDCSSFLVIPNIDYQTNLPASGETLIEIPPQKSGATLLGVCGMGMYSFAIEFR